MQSTDVDPNAVVVGPSVQGTVPVAVPAPVSVPAGVDAAVAKTVSVGLTSVVSVEPDKVGNPAVVDQKKKRRKIIRAEEEESVAKKFGRYFIPLLSILVFILLVMFVYIPFGTEAFDRKDETDLLLEEIEWNEGKISVLESINVNELDGTISDVSEFVRDEMDVAKLAAEVEEIALFNNLDPKDLTFSDMGESEKIQVSQIVKGEWAPGFSSSINGPFAFYGEFLDVVHFIDELRNESPTILYIDLINVSRYQITEPEDETEDEDEDKELWSVDIMIYSYTSLPVSTANIKDSVTVEVDQDILDRIRERMAVGGTADDVEEEREEDSEEDEESS